MYDSLTLKMLFRDYQKLSSCKNDEKKKSFEWNNLLFVGKPNEIGDITSYTSKLGNLLLIASDSHNLYIKNSLHKFYKGENYSDFTRSEVLEAIEKLEHFIPKSSKAKVKKIDTAVNYLPASNESWLYHSWQPFVQMTSNGSIYGYKCIRSKYNIKGYEKAVEVANNKQYQPIKSVPKNLWRYEIQNKYLERFKSKGLTSIRLEDLANFDVMQIFGNDLLHQYKQIKMNEIDFNQLQDLHEIKVVATMQNIDALEVLKNDFKDRYKDYRKKYNQIIKRQSNGENLAIIKEKIDHFISA